MTDQNKTGYTPGNSAVGTVSGGASAACLVSHSPVPTASDRSEKGPSRDSAQKCRLDASDSTEGASLLDRIVSQPPKPSRKRAEKLRQRAAERAERAELERILWEILRFRERNGRFIAQETGTRFVPSVSVYDIKSKESYGEVPRPISVEECLRELTAEFSEDGIPATLAGIARWAEEQAAITPEESEQLLTITQRRRRR